MADYFRKTKSLYASTTNTFGTGTSVTITPNSVTGLPTDTEITLTFDRVDSTGAETPAKMERIIGTISGGNFVVRTSPSTGRGADGTSDAAHTSPVVEYINNAKDINDRVDGILVEHNQDGTHKTATVTTLKATASEITTGTVDTKLITPKGLKDAGIVAASGSLATDTLWAAKGDLVKGTANDTADILSIGTAEDILRVVSGAPAWVGANFKVNSTTRDMTAASGDVSYTSVGFKPKAIIFIAIVDAGPLSSIGFDDATGHKSILMQAADTWSYSTAYSIFISGTQKAIVKSFDSDGFTLTWTKESSPTGTAQIMYLAFR